MPSVPDLPKEIIQLILAAAFLAPPIYLCLVELRDPRTPRRKKILIATPCLAILAAFGLIALLLGEAGRGFDGFGVAWASILLTGIIILPSYVATALLFAFSLAKRISDQLSHRTDRPAETSATKAIGPKTNFLSREILIILAFIGLIAATIYLGLV